MLRRISVFTPGLGKFFLSSSEARRTQDNGRSPMRAPLPNATPLRMRNVLLLIPFGGVGSEDIRCSHFLLNSFMSVYLLERIVDLLQSGRFVIPFYLFRQSVTPAGLGLMVRSSR